MNSSEADLTSNSIPNLTVPIRFRRSREYQSIHSSEGSASGFFTPKNSAAAATASGHESDHQVSKNTNTATRPPRCLLVWFLRKPPHHVPDIAWIWVGYPVLTPEPFILLLLSSGGGGRGSGERQAWHWQKETGPTLVLWVWQHYPNEKHED